MRRHLDVVAHGLRFYGMLIFAVTVVSSALAGVATWFTGEMTMAWLVPAMVAMGALIAAPFLATGRGLLAGKAWARIAGIVLSCMIITDFPIGMSLGILGLGVLLDEDVARSFQVQSEAAPVLEADGRRAALAQARRRVSEG